MKHHGRQRKTKALIRAKEKRSSQLTGPKAFPLDRMMAIFYSIVDDHVRTNGQIKLLTSQMKRNWNHGYFQKGIPKGRK